MIQSCCRATANIEEIAQPIAEKCQVGERCLYFPSSVAFSGTPFPQLLSPQYIKPVQVALVTHGDLLSPHRYQNLWVFILTDLGHPNLWTQPEPCSSFLLSERFSEVLRMPISGKKFKSYFRVVFIGGNVTFFMVVWLSCCLGCPRQTWRHNVWDNRKYPRAADNNCWQSESSQLVREVEKDTLSES